MNVLHAVILGLVEGITEYLPISSTGHLVIASSLLGLQDPARPGLREAVKSFDIVIQGGAILAVLGLYWPRILRMIRGVLGRDREGLRLAINLAVAFVPFAIVAKLTHEWVTEHLMRAEPVIAVMIIGGVYMIVVDRWHRGRRPPTAASADAVMPADGELGTAAGTETTPTTTGENGQGEIGSLSVLQAAFIGILQCVAIIPGTSRSMMTITGGFFVGLRPAAAAEFSFLLGLPTLGAATLYSLYKNLKSSRAGEAAADGVNNVAAGGTSMFDQLSVTVIVVGLVVATVSAALAIRWLVGFLNKHGLSAFGWYRIIVGVALLGLVLGEVVKIE